MRLVTFSTRQALIVQLALCVAFVYALVAGLSPLVPASAASRTAAVPAAQVADLRYVLDGADPSRVAAVELRLTAGAAAEGPAPLVEVQLGPDAPLLPCSPAEGVWRCPLPLVDLQAATSLRVRVIP